MTTRRRFIVDMVEKYKEDYPDEYQDFLKMMEWRRANMKDKKFGEIEGAEEIRGAASLPDRLTNLLLHVLNGTDEPFPFEPKGEMKWFVKKFPEFLLPRSY